MRQPHLRRSRRTKQLHRVNQLPAKKGSGDRVSQAWAHPGLLIQNGRNASYSRGLLHNAGQKASCTYKRVVIPDADGVD